MIKHTWKKVYRSHWKCVECGAVIFSLFEPTVRDDLLMIYYYPTGSSIGIQQLISNILADCKEELTAQIMTM